MFDTPRHQRSLLIDRLRAQIRAMQSQRRYRDDFVDGKVGWVRYEQMHLWGLINEHREVHEKEPLPFEVVRIAEEMASGHSDYTDKLALYSMELVLLHE
jgi:hypothetical protein